MFGIVGAILLFAPILGYLVDAAWLALHITQPMISAFQRLFLGIDKVKAGAETVIGQHALIDRHFRRKPGETCSEGIVRVDGEFWRARSGADERELSKGQLVVISGRDGLTLTIEPTKNT